MSGPGDPAGVRGRAGDDRRGPRWPAAGTPEVRARVGPMMSVAHVRAGSKKSLKKHHAREVIAAALPAYRGTKEVVDAVEAVLSACSHAGL